MKIIISQESLDNFKKYVRQNSPGEISTEFESLYGCGNAPEQPTDEDWKNLMDEYIREGFYEED